MADEAERNIISGNSLFFFGSGVVVGGDDNIVAGNYIGTDVTGTVALGNGGESGITIAGARNRIGTNGDGLADATERNVIAGNTGHSVLMRVVGADENVIAGNYIGTDVTGTVAMGNGGDGVSIILVPSRT